MTQEQIKAEIHKIVDFAIEHGFVVKVFMGRSIETNHHDGWENHIVTSLTEETTWGFNNFGYTPLNQHIDKIKTDLLT